MEERNIEYINIRGKMIKDITNLISDLISKKHKVIDMIDADEPFISDSSDIVLH